MEKIGLKPHASETRLTRVVAGLKSRYEKLPSFLDRLFHQLSLTPAEITLSLEIMLRLGISQFVGSWVSASGYCLLINKVRKDLASVDFLDPNGAPVQRLYMGGAPATNMVAHYDGYYSNFEVELWEERKFILHLSHEYDYELDPEKRESLEPALSWNAGDRSLDKWRSSFGPLDHFVRKNEQTASNNRKSTTTSKEKE